MHTWHVKTSVRGRAVLLRTPLHASPSKLQLHNPSSAPGINQDGQRSLLQKGLCPQPPLLLQCPRKHTVCLAEAEED